MDAPIPFQDLIDLVERRQPGGDPLAYLTESVLVSDQLGELADDLVGHFVALAREGGASWAEVGASLGVPKQAAQKRFVSGARRGARGKGLFTRFDAPAREVVKRAVAHAQQGGQGEIGTLHLLLGLIDDGECLAARAIVGLDVSLGEVRVAARGAMAPGREGGRRGHIPFGDDSKKVLELALREAIRVGDRQIRTEHILLAILRDERSAGSKALAGLQITRRSVEDWLEAAA